MTAIETAMTAIKASLDNWAGDLDILAAVQAWMWLHVKFADDQALFGVKQRTVSAEETLQLGRGDCEDYAWCCFVLATGLGISPDDLSIELCTVHGAASHVVLMYRDGQLVLDNQLAHARPLAGRSDLSGLRQLSTDSFPKHAGDPDPGLKLA
jgi:predicted transglutaminase-like cysteine proteinase